MEVQDKLFLQAFRAYLKKEKVNWENKLSKDIWRQLFQQADRHRVLPMIYEAVYDCPAAKKTGEGLVLPYKRNVVQQVMTQAMKTDEFLKLYTFLGERGIYPLVIKGIVCREFYPNLDYRVSGDEDLLVMPEEFEKCHEALLEYGMKVSGEEEIQKGSYEVPYVMEGTPLYIELHKSLFPQESKAYGELNQYFKDVHERKIWIEIQNVPIATMDYTEHLFYLICHALKHFMHSGFGIRQVCDIVLFANRYGQNVDWNLMLRQCKLIHAEQFASAIFKIGYKYMTFSPAKAGYPEKWKNILVDETAMLKDLLDGGIYGNSDMSRVHSSAITLNAVEEQKQGEKQGHYLIKTIFPPVDKMKKKYSYVQKYPVLLPVAWGSRIMKYWKETATTKGNRAEDSIHLGNQRILLLKQYGILE